MGSSKKHKERDRDHKRRKKHRSRSRSRSPVRSREQQRPEEERKRRRGSSDREDELRRTKDRGRVKAERDEEPRVGDRQPVNHAEDQRGDDEQASAGGGATLSLSIEETNKLRAKLGMKPLELGTPSESKGDKESLKDDIHRPAINLGSKKKTEALQEKLTVLKEKRKISEKLKQVKTLGESDGEDDAKAWVQKSRQAEEEKKKAELRAKQLQQMDEEFGVSSLVAEELGPVSAPSYTQNQLKGLKVEHAQSRFEAGKTVILTLADKGVLDEEDDTLMNLEITDQEKAERNIINKSKRPDYKAYEEDEDDEYGMLRQKDVLQKYDEEIDGEKKKSFVLGRGGKYGGEEERAMEHIREQLQSGKLTLESAAPQLLSEYYSKEEMESFKKRTKKVRKIHRKVMKADDLLAHADVDNSQNLGSRSGRWLPSAAVSDEQQPSSGANEEEPSSLAAGSGAGAGEAAAPIVGDVTDQKSKVNKGLSSIVLPPLDDTDDIGPDEDLTGVVIDDEAQNELQSALSRAIKLKLKKEASGTTEKLAELLTVKKEPASPEHKLYAAALPVKEHEGSSSIVLNTTDEFCRTLGNMPTYGQSGNREENEEELMDFEKELLEQRRQQDEEEEKGGWEEVGIDDRKVEVGISDETGILDDEPIVTSGVAAALALAHKKGFIEREVQKKGKTVRNAEELLAKNYSIEDKRYDDIDEKYRKRGDARDRFGGGGMLTEFKEKEDYKPEFRLEYMDDKGRRLNQKEAFRQLSHRFHGKGSGKKKTEKRAKKVEEEELMKQMSSTDTPLNTLSRLIEKQEKEKAAFIVLSGGQKTMTSHTVMK